MAEIHVEPAIVINNLVAPWWAFLLFRIHQVFAAIVLEFLLMAGIDASAASNSANLH